MIGKCLSISRRNSPPTFVFTGLENGGLNQIIVLCRFRFEREEVGVALVVAGLWLE